MIHTEESLYGFTVGNGLERAAQEEGDQLERRHSDSGER